MIAFTFLAASAAPALEQTGNAPSRDLLFATTPRCPTCPTMPEIVPTCPTTPPAMAAYGVDPEKNKVFDQLTVAEQVSIESFMAEKYSIQTGAWGKGATSNFSTIAKIAYVYPPKADVVAYLDGTGPMPPRKATFWWLNGAARPRVAGKYMITLPITTETTIELVREHPWNERPFVYWEYGPSYSDALAILAPLFTDILASVVITDEMKALYPEEYTGENEGKYPYVSYHTNGLDVPGSSHTHRQELGATMIIAGPDDGWNMGMMKAGPLTFSTYYDFDLETTVINELVWCPGLGNPTFDSPEALLAAFTAGTLQMCGIDGEHYGSAKEYMDPFPTPDPDLAEMAAKAEPRIYYPDGPRFTVSGRTVSWMGWDFHADIHGLYGMMISNLRFKGERIGYELHATEFSAVYSGASNKKDLYYSDGGYEMGNCATTLKTGLQCPDEAVFLPSLGYDSGYVWGGQLEGSETPKAMCIFEAPNNEALYQHAQMRNEGVPSSSLYVRSVLTVGNYDYTQTFKVDPDGAFHFNKQLSGYGVGHYVLPDVPSTVKQTMFGALMSRSSVGTLHTHSAGYKFDLDIGGTSNSFAVKTVKYGPMAEAYAAGSPAMDLTGVATSSADTYYFEEEKITNEGMWDMDGDGTWTAPASCFYPSAGQKFVVKSDDTDMLGQSRGYLITVPVGQPQLLPEHNGYLHLQNFTKCAINPTKQNEADIESVPMDVFGNLYPKAAATGHDISQFVNGENLEHEDLVIYASSTKPHWVKTEDLPVPTTMGKPISFEPFNYMKDAIAAYKHFPGGVKEAAKCTATGA